MTRLALDHNAINLAQGFPNFSAPQSIKDAACRAIQDDINQSSLKDDPNYFHEDTTWQTECYLEEVLNWFT